MSKEREREREQKRKIEKKKKKGKRKALGLLTTERFTWVPGVEPKFILPTPNRHHCRSRLGVAVVRATGVWWLVFGSKRIIVIRLSFGARAREKPSLPKSSDNYFGN